MQRLIRSVSCSLVEEPSAPSARLPDMMCHRSQRSFHTYQMVHEPVVEGSGSGPVHREERYVHVHIHVIR